MYQQQKDEELCILTNQPTNGVVNMKVKKIDSYRLLERLEDVQTHVDALYTIFSDISQINGKLEHIINYEPVNEQGDDYDKAYCKFENAVETVHKRIKKLDPILKMTEDEIREGWDEMHEEQFNPHQCDGSNERLFETLESVK